MDVELLAGDSRHADSPWQLAYVGNAYVVGRLVLALK